MTLDGNAGTAVAEAQAPETGTAPRADEVTTLRSRAAGLDAKVTALLAEAAAEKARADAAEARALALADEKTNGDAELRAELERTKALVAEKDRAVLLAGIKAQYPETFSVLGDVAATLTADQLAASEARFAGVPSTPETPTPVGANPARPQAGGAKAIEDMSAKELEVHMRQFDPSVMFRQND